MAARFCCFSYNVSGLPNPQSWARHLRLCPSANAVTGQGLGEVSAANGAGNPVLCVVVVPHCLCPLGRARPNLVFTPKARIPAQQSRPAGIQDSINYL